MAANHGHVPCVVENPVFLFVGRVMLFIDHDHAQIGKGQKQRRTGADNNTDVTAGRLPPDFFAHAWGDIGVPFCRFAAETLLKTIKKS